MITKNFVKLNKNFDLNQKEVNRGDNTYWKNIHKLLNFIKTRRKPCFFY